MIQLAHILQQPHTHFLELCLGLVILFTFMSLAETTNRQKESVKDRCVICNAETEYDHSTHIDNREYYIEGSGQLCPPCYHPIMIDTCQKNKKINKLKGR